MIFRKKVQPMEKDDGRDRKTTEATPSSPDQGADSGAGALPAQVAGAQQALSGYLSDPRADPNLAGIQFQIEQRMKQARSAAEVRYVREMYEREKEREKAEYRRRTMMQYQPGVFDLARDRIIAPPEPKIPDAGIKVGEFEGWRAWRLKSSFLRSVYREDLWLPGKEVTGKPDNRNEGVHAWKSMPLCLEYGITQSSVIVVGRVKLWGIVIEHEHGYRAEHVKITAFDYVLAEDPNYPEEAMLQKLRQRYGVVE